MFRNIIIGVTLLNVLFGVVSPYKILVLLPYPGKSHYMVFEPLLNEMLDRGHQLTVVSFFPETQTRMNRRDISLLGISEIYKEVIDITMFEKSHYGLEQFLQHVPLVTNLAQNNIEICEKLINWPNMQEFWNGQGEYDLIIYEAFNSDCMLPLIKNYNLPFIGLMSSEILPFTPDRLGFPDTPSYVADMMVGAAGRFTFQQRFVNTIVHYFYKLYFSLEVRPKEENLLSRKYKRKLPPLEEMAKNVSVVFINTHYSLNGVKSTVPSLVEIGGIHLKRNSSAMPYELQHFLDEAPSPGVILFSFGSLVRGSTLPKHRLEAFLQVFSNLPHRIIWKWEGEPLPNLPKNVKQVQWVPQYEILGHPKCIAFITHGGLLSLTETVHHGKPALIIPLLGDQFLNAAHAQKAGIGTVLSYREVTVATLESALNSTLSDGMRRSAAKLSKIWRDRPIDPMDEAIYWIERTAKFGFEADLSGPVRFMPFYQQIMLDVFAVIFIILAALFGVFFFTVRFILKKIFSNSGSIKIKMS